MALRSLTLSGLALAVAALAVSAGAQLALSGTLADKKPHQGVAAAHTMPIQGIDVSYWQGDIDWQRAQAAGLRIGVQR